MNAFPEVCIDNVVVDVASEDPSLRGGSFIYVDLSAVDNETKTIIAAREMLRSEAPSRARQLLEVGDILVSTVRPNLNAVAMVSTDLAGAVGSTGFCVLRVDPSLATPGYLFHWLRSKSFVSAMTKLATGQSYPAVSDRIIKTSTLPLPPLPEQRRIAEILDQADLLSTRRQNTVAKIDLLPQSIFLDFFGDPALNPKDWETRALGDFLLEPPIYGTMIPPGQDGQSLSYRVGNIQNWRLDLSDKKYVNLAPHQVKRFSLQHGDILLARAIASLAHLGKCVIVPETPNQATFDSHLMRLRLDSTKLLPEYLVNLLQTKGGRALFLAVTRRSAVQFNVNTAEMKSLRIPVPPISIQKAFQSTVGRIIEQRHVMYKSSQSCNRLFASLQSRSFPCNS